MSFAGIPETPIEYWLGTDRALDFTVYTSLGLSTIRDVTGYTTNFMVKTTPDDPDAAALLSIDGVVSGTFNANPSVNTQKITVTIPDDATDTELQPIRAHWELKRTDAGQETPLAYGRIQLRRAVHIA